MPKQDFEDKEYDGNIAIVVKSQDHLARLLEEGFEIDGMQMRYVDGQMHWTLKLKKDEKTSLANADAIGEYAMHLQCLYDFKKKKPVFTWVPSTEVYWDFEVVMAKMIFQNEAKPIRTKNLSLYDSNKIFDIIRRWLVKERALKYGIDNLSEIFYKVLVINEINNKISSRVYLKEILTLDKIREICCESGTVDNSIALSCFFLSKLYKSNKEVMPFDDMLIGMIIYSLKTSEVLGFNIQSAASFYRNNNFVPGRGLFDIVESMVSQSIEEDGTVASYLPLPVDSPWYTCLPWLCYSALSALPNDTIEDEAMSNNLLSIPEFFTFCYPKSPQDGYSFSFNHFSSARNGRATCILYSNDSKNPVAYTLRFDQSEGERLVHLDFQIGNLRPKIISHRRLDIEDVHTFSPELFISCLAAGACDAYFTSIIEDGIEGIERMMNKNPAFLYPLRLIWQLDTAIMWLNENTQGYDILNKMRKSQPLTPDEVSFSKQMIDRFPPLLSEDEQCSANGITNFGYLVLQRFARGMTQVSMAPIEE
jgi:hypothetical protein